MAEQVILPRQGQSVETCLILSWKKREGDPVSEGEILVEVETDKAAFEVESTAGGTLLKILHQEGEDVPVLSALAIVGKPGEDLSSLTGTARAQPDAAAEDRPAVRPEAREVGKKIAISPRARRTAAKRGLTPGQILASLPEGRGSGPRGRILERDVDQSAGRAATAGAAPAGVAAATPPSTADFPGPVQEVPVKGIRRLIAERMLSSLQGSAQYTLHSSASAEALLVYRQKLKSSPEELGLQAITINDLLNYAVTRVLLRFPAVNSHFDGDKSLLFERVHLAVAVDTPRGLMVPVIRNASTLSLKRITAEAARLRKACLEGTVIPDELNGGTFTVSNMGSSGIEGFTPVLNPPQVAILGVGCVQLKPVEREGEVVFERSLSLSLTANHQILDGAPAAGFLRELCRALESFELLLVD
jgi:pyruvate dehydrogenase E2 component (dihydrolipoamide acetyltransferase)